MKLELLKLREDTQLKADFQSGESLVSFWATQKEDYPRLAEKALTMLVQAPSTYRCEAGFSVMVTIKSKARDRLVIDGDMRCCLTSYIPRFGRLLAAKQHQISH